MFNKRITLTGADIEEMIAQLSKLPKNMKVYTCGSESQYLHVDTEKNVCVLDDSELDECYEEEGEIHN